MRTDGAERAPAGARRPIVVVAGATGFVGRALAERLAHRATVIGLSRSAKTAAPGAAVAEWRACDLFSLRDAEAALVGADVAVYLVHSMSRGARLTQASFEDLDLILADNFARAAERAGVRQIVFLSGIVPPGSDLSPHLASRLEVERALAGRSVPVTVVRAGLVMGAGGSSFRILRRLVERLPAMALPRWTTTPMTPVRIEDVVTVLAGVCGDERFLERTGDVGFPEPVTYAELIAATAAALGVRRPVVRVPLVSPGLSRWWVQLVTGADAELVKPLVGSVDCPMAAGDLSFMRELQVEPPPFAEALAAALEADRAHEREERSRSHRAGRPTAQTGGEHERCEGVRSVQRLCLPPGRDAVWLARDYARWLPRAMWPLIRVVERDGDLAFTVPLLRRPLLELTWAADRSPPDRQLFYITGGLLADTTRSLRGRLEFREVLGGGAAVAAIHEFSPRLPWWLYRATQAVVHLLVMRAFQRRQRALCAARPG